MTGRRLRAAVGALALGTAACATPPDLGAAWRTITGPLPEAGVALESVPTETLPAPEGVTAHSGALRAVPLTWEPLLAGDVAGYAVERARVREGPFDRVAVVEGRTQTAWVDRGGAPADLAYPPLADGDTCFYRVRAYSSAGRLGIDPSEIAVATTAQAPDPPEDLRGYSHQPRQVPLSWQASENPTVAGYVIYRSPSSRGPFERLATLEGRYNTVYVDRQLGDLRLLYYRVAARNAAGGEGPPTEPVQAVTKSEPLPPIGLRVVERLLGVNRLAWEPNVETDLVEYRLLRFRQGRDTAEVVSALRPDTTQAEDDAVAAGESLTYALVAVDRDGLESPTSERVAVESEGYALSADSATEEVRLTWNPRSEQGFVGARVLRRGWIRPRELGFVRGAEYVDRDVVPGRRYRYVVILEGSDARTAPPSQPLEVRVPRP